MGDDDTLLAHTQQIFEHSKHQTLYRLVCQDPFIALRPVYQYFPLIMMMSATLFASYECTDTSINSSGVAEATKPSLIERILGITMYAEQCERSVEPVVKKCIIESGAQSNICIKIIGKGQTRRSLQHSSSSEPPHRQCRTMVGYLLRYHHPQPTALSSSSRRIASWKTS